jgi:hypothetical protein
MAGATATARKLLQQAAQPQHPSPAAAAAAAPDAASCQVSAGLLAIPTAQSAQSRVAGS